MIVNQDILKQQDQSLMLLKQGVLLLCRPRENCVGRKLDVCSQAFGPDFICMARAAQQLTGPIKQLSQTPSRLLCKLQDCKNTMLSRFTPRVAAVPFRNSAIRATTFSLSVRRNVTTDAASSHVEKEHVPEVCH